MIYRLLDLLQVRAKGEEDMSKQHASPEIYEFLIEKQQRALSLYKETCSALKSALTAERARAAALAAALESELLFWSKRQELYESTGMQSHNTQERIASLRAALAAHRKARDE